MRKAAGKALSLLGYENAELSVLVTGDLKMRALNRYYRGIDRTTDVLSFPMLEAEGSRAEGVTDVPLALGDIVISAPKAAAQAKEYGHGIDDEMLALLVHGILHLIGYDHEKGPAESRRMKAKERQLIRLLKP